MPIFKTPPAYLPKSLTRATVKELHTLRYILHTLQLFETHNSRKISLIIKLLANHLHRETLATLSLEPIQTVLKAYNLRTPWRDFNPAYPTRSANDILDSCCAIQKGLTYRKHIHPPLTELFLFASQFPKRIVVHSNALNEALIHHNLTLAKWINYTRHPGRKNVVIDKKTFYSALTLNTSSWAEALLPSFPISSLDS